MFGIFANGGNGYTYSYSDKLCRNNEGAFLVFNDDTDAKLFLLQYKDDIRKCNELDSEYLELKIERIR